MVARVASRWNLRASIESDRFLKPVRRIPAHLIAGQGDPVEHRRRSVECPSLEDGGQSARPGWAPSGSPRLTNQVEGPPPELIQGDRVNGFAYSGAVEPGQETAPGGVED
jgi:hypothetical protein